MQSSGCLLWGSLLLLPAMPVHGEVLRLKCADGHDTLVVQYVIDTDRQHMSQIAVGGRLTHPVVVSITDQVVRFVDLSGEARLENRLHRASGELVSEVLEGKERGVSFYLTCRRADE